MIQFRLRDQPNRKHRFRIVHTCCVDGVCCCSSGSCCGFGWTVRLATDGEWVEWRAEVAGDDGRDNTKIRPQIPTLENE